MRIKNYNPDDLEIELLALLGNNQPTLTQMDLMRKLVQQMGITKQLILDKRLSPQERNCLFYAAHGYSTRGTAAILQCTPPTIKHYRSEVLEKLDCANMAHAVFVGIKYGYLCPQDKKEEEDLLS